MLRGEIIDEIKQVPPERLVPVEVKKLVNRKNGVIYYNGQAQPLEKNLKISSKLYVTIKNEDKFELFVKEDQGMGDKYIINYDDKTFDLIEDILTPVASDQSASKVRKMTLQPRVKRTEDFLPLTFILDGGVPHKQVSLMGMWIKVEYSPSVTQ